MYYEINGNILPQVRLADRAVLEPPYVHKRRKPDEFILYVMTRGTLYLKENEKTYELREGDTILLDPDFVHQGVKASECEYFYIHFRHGQIRRRREDAGFSERQIRKRGDSLKEDNGSWSRYRDSLLSFPKTVRLQNPKSYLRVISLLEEAVMQNRNQLENYKVLCGSRVMEALVEIAREAVSAEYAEMPDRAPGSCMRVQELLTYINTNYQEPISGKMIEEKFAYNFDHLNRIFKKMVGRTIFVYLNEVRIHHARELLSTTSMKISAVGYRVGFPDESYFCKAFKKSTGMSPKQYEQMASQPNMAQKKPG